MDKDSREARLKAMRLLTARDYTEQALRDKLKQGGFSPEDTEDAISYVKSYGYVDDLRYARNYARSSSGVRSALETRRKLMNKGVAGDLIDQAISEEYDGDEAEDELIRRLIRKRVRDPENMDLKARQKVLSYMYGKGFKPDRVNRILEEVLLDITSQTV